MALTLDEKYTRYLLPMVLDDSDEIDTALTALAEQIHTLIVGQLDGGVTYMADKLLPLMNVAALSDAQTAQLRAKLAERLNRMMQGIYVS